MKFIFATLMLLSFAANAAPVRRLYQPIKIPGGQDVLEHQTVTPEAASTTNIKNGYAGNTSAAAVTLTSFVENPDVPRNIVITPGGTTTDVAACNIVVNGTNIFDATISETFAFAENASSATTGTEAFKTITSVVFPANCEDSAFGATWSIGQGEKIGLNRCMAGNFVLQTNVGGTKETTLATVAYDADEVEKNTADFNGTMNGSNLFDIFFVQNFACFP